ncbi:MAG: CocE/NonD family hydrolase [Chitinophagales bacterium]
MNKHSIASFFLAFAIFCAISIDSQAQKDKDYQPTDIAIDLPKPYKSVDHGSYKGLKATNFYLLMRDSVKIAMDLYLPKNLEAGAKLPTLVHQTRYWRSPDLRWPFSMFTNGLIGPMGEAITEIVESGYAVVNIDSRGSGASFGDRKYPWSEEEYNDLAEIVDWIIQQEWSNQNVGTVGVSYSGTTAEFALVNQHPNIKCGLILYSLFDVYEDIAFPGGIYHEFFVENWGKFNNRLDKNELPRKSFVARLLVKGVRRVNGPKKVRTFKDAIREHEANIQVSESSDGIVYKDDVPANKAVASSAVFSPSSYITEINNSRAAVYLYSGWLDGNYQRASIRKFLNYDNPQNKLLIGPWEHSGRYNCSPNNPGKSGFDHVGEFLKFFDYHLKGVDNGLYNEPKVHYFTMAENKWKSSEKWPVDAQIKTLYFGDNHTLNSDKPATEEALFDHYKVDTTAGTGDDSRWKSVIGMLKTGAVYPDREEQNKKNIVYDSAPLESNLEVTGHPIITLYINSTATDGNFHAYLEDVDEAGNVHLITEGLLRGLHRKLSDEKPPYKIVAPYRSYLSKDGMPLIPGEVAELVFDLIPTSYQFKKGHKIRISLAGADKDHFGNAIDEEPEWKVYRNALYPSKIELPVVGE